MNYSFIKGAAITLRSDPYMFYAAILVWGIANMFLSIPFVLTLLTFKMKCRTIGVHL